MVAGRRHAARRAWRRGRGYVGRARIGDDGVVGAALAAALAAALGARGMSVVVLFAVLVANVDGLAVVVAVVVVVVVMGGHRRRRRRKLRVHGRISIGYGCIGIQRQLQGRIVGGCRREVGHDIDEAESCPQRRQDKRLHGVCALRALGDLVLCERSIPRSGHFWAAVDTCAHANHAPPHPAQSALPRGRAEAVKTESAAPPPPKRWSSTQLCISARPLPWQRDS